MNITHPRPRTSGWVTALAAAGGLAGALVLALVLYPSVVLLGHAFIADAALTLDHHVRLAADGATWVALRNSLVFASASAVLATALGASLAWLVARTDLPGRRFWHVALLVPYMIPPFIGAMAWVYLLSPVGYLNQAWQALTGAAGPLAVIYGPVGIVFVLTLYEYPIAYVAALGLLARANPAFEEAARIAGARPASVFWDITRPLILPGVAAGAVLVFLSSLANFGIAAVIGVPARTYVLPTRIYNLISNFDLRNNLQLAAALSMWLVVTAVMLLIVQAYVLRGARFASVVGQAAQPTRVALGRARGSAVAAVALFATITAVLPMAAVLLTALTRAYGLSPEPANLTLAHFQTVVFGVDKVRRAFANSALLSIAAATFVVVLAVVIAYLLARVRVRFARALDVLVTMPYAVPGTVVALAMILAWLRPIPGTQVVLYNTVWILLIAYVARFLVLGVRTTLAALMQVHDSLEEAARISGASPGQAFRDVVFPIIKPSLAAGWFLVFVPALAELTLSVLLFSVGNETIGVIIFGLHEEGKVALAAAVASLVTFALVTAQIGGRALLRDDGAA